MQAEAEVRAADDARVVLGLEPPGAQLHAPRRQARKSPLELGAAAAVAGDENHEVGKAPRRLPCFPSTDALFEVPDGVDHQIEILIRGPARGTHNEANRRRVADIEPHEQRLPDSLALRAIDWRERGRRPIVEDAYRVRGFVGQVEPFGEKPLEPARDTEMRIGGAAAVLLQPAGQPYDEIAAPETQRENRVTEIVPVDDEADPPKLRRNPRHLQRRN